MVNNKLVFSGYVQCMRCLNANMTFQTHGGCNKCNRREFEYGVLLKGKFIPYAQLIERVKRGDTFIDGTNQGLPITRKTFGLKDAVRKEQQSFK